MAEVEYVYYFTGLRPEYLPSWCGELDNSFGKMQTWEGCVLQDTTVYNPSHNYSLIAPYKQMLWSDVSEANLPHQTHGMYLALLAAEKRYRNKTGRPSPIIKHSNHELKNHRPELYKQYKSVIFIPYQTSLMTFFELYRQDIPMFAPSVKLLIAWHKEYKILKDRIYGWPKRLTQKIALFTGKDAEEMPDPNSDKDESLEFWFPYSDIYVYEHITYFDSWDHLLELIDSTDLAQISRQMAEFNAYERDAISLQWDELYSDLIPKRNRSSFMAETGIDVEFTKSWLRTRQRLVRSKIRQLQGTSYKCARARTFTNQQLDLKNKCLAQGNLLPYTPNERRASGAKVLGEPFSERIPKPSKD